MKTILPEQEKAITSFETPRDYLFDNLKFILIILVVFGHLIERYINQSIYLKVIFINVYLFHMPLFVFISGYFTKSIKSLSAAKSIRQLIIPYIFFVILWNVVHKVNTGDYDLFLPPFHLWYLLSLFFWKTFLPVIKQVKFYLLISVIIAVLVGLNTNVGYYLSLSRTLTLFPFFILGSITSKETFYKIYAKKYLAIIGGSVCLIACSILIYNFNPPNLNIIHWGLPYKLCGFSMLNSILVRSVLYILAAILSAGFIALIPKGKTFYSKLGTRTLQIYILHPFILGAFFNYFPIWNHSILTNIIILIFPVFLSVVLALPIVEFLYNKLFDFINKLILINGDAVV